MSHNYYRFLMSGQESVGLGPLMGFAHMSRPIVRRFRRAYWWYVQEISEKLGPTGAMKTAKWPSPTDSYVRERDATSLLVNDLPPGVHSVAAGSHVA